jgi:hypothetical protein
LRAVDAAQTPGNGAQADLAIEQGKMLVGHGSVPGLRSIACPNVN